MIMVTLLNLTGTCASDSFNFRAKRIDQTGKNGRIDAVETMVPLKYSSNFWRTLEMPLINCEVNLICTWSANCVIIYINVGNQNLTYEVTETKVYVPVVTLSIQDGAKLLQLITSDFKGIIN